MVRMAGLTSELAFLLEREKVKDTFSQKLADNGIDSIAKFAAIVDTQVEMRELLKDEFGMDSKGGGLEIKSQVAAILVAWTAAKKRAAKQAEQEGESEVRNEPKKIQASDHTAMKTAFESQHWTLEDELLPSKGYIEKLLDRVENMTSRPSVSARSPA